MSSSRTTSSMLNLLDSESSTDSLPLFRYEPLAPGEIRLLIPTDDESGLTWTLQIASLNDETLRFEALSYVWGSQDSTFAITCNNQRHYVHHNLYTALPYLARRCIVHGSHHCRFSAERPTPEKQDEQAKHPADGTRECEPVLPIWIDALCIDQNEEKEKRVQIAAMNLVYRRANRVWIWLGLAEEEELLEEAIALLPVLIHAGIRMRRMRHLHKAGEDNINSIDNDWIVGELDERQEGLPLWYMKLINTRPELWCPLAHLLCNSWFQRVWIVQEFVLAQSAVFLTGKHTVTMPLFEQALRHVYHPLHCFAGHKIRSDGLEGSIQSYAVFNMREFVREHLQLMQQSTPAVRRAQDAANIQLHLSIHISMGQQCCSPRDRVIGILGILSTKQYESLGVDLYSIKDISKLYTDFSTALLNLATLCQDDASNVATWKYIRSACGAKALPGLPLWVLDLHSPPPNPRVSFAKIEYTASRQYCVGKSGKEYGQLMIRGQRVCTIATVCGDIPETPQLPIHKVGDIEHTEKQILALHNFAKWGKSARESIVRLWYGTDHENQSTQLPLPQGADYWYTLLAGGTMRGESDVTQEVYEHFHASSQLFSVLYQNILDNPGIVPQSFDAAYADAGETTFVDFADILKRFQDDQTSEGSFIKQMGKFGSRYLFFTADKRVGISAQKVLEGDVVCVFNGAPLPHVLRKADDQGTEAYRLVDEAYVHSLANGEVDEMDIQAQDFILV